jgi:hypothetical protein
MIASAKNIFRLFLGVNGHFYSQFINSFLVGIVLKTVKNEVEKDRGEPMA